jgi:Family of unknown function (DUF6256)
MTVLAASADRQALVPMAAGYLILMSALALGLRRLDRPRAAQPGPRQPAGPGPAVSRRRGGGAVLARQVTGTVVGGYLLLMAVVVAYYYAVARVGPGFLHSAARRAGLGAWLAGLARDTGIFSRICKATRRNIPLKPALSASCRKTA